MSNVLIGIIGVILFIGLALAGALFLGPRFQQSKSTTTASAVVQSVSQISSAVVLRNSQTGTTSQASIPVSQMVSEAYMKSPAPNPGGDDPVVVSYTGDVTGDARLVVARLTNSAAADVCGAIVRQTQAADATIGANGYTVAADYTAIPKGPAGCFQVGSVAIGSLQPNQFYSFARI